MKLMSDLYCHFYITVEGLSQEVINSIATNIGSAVMCLPAQTDEGTLEWTLGPIVDREVAQYNLVNVRSMARKQYNLEQIGFSFYHYPQVPRSHLDIFALAHTAYQALLDCYEVMRAEEYKSTLLRNSFEGTRDVIAFTRRYVNLVEREEESDATGSEEPY